jgi:NADH-quinone oxidoreductase subunit G
VLRILPRVNDEVNEEWMADKGRFSFDGLKRRRLDSPWLRVHGKLHKVSWQDAFASIGHRLEGVHGDRIGAIAGDLCDAESMLALKDLMTSLGSGNIDCRQDGARYDVSRREFYIFNSTIAGIEEADALLLVGCDPRHEAPVLNARIRKRWLAGNLAVGVIGNPARDLTYEYAHLGDRPAALKGLLDASLDFAAVLKAAKHPMIILGQAALARDDAPAIQAACWQLAREVGALDPQWNGFNVLHHAAARVAGLDMGFVPASGCRSVAGMMSGGVEVLWLLNADEFHPARIGPETFVIYQGHHGDASAARADVILPGATFVEKPGTYVNTEGRVQRGMKAIFPPGEAKEDWRILRAVSEVVGHKLPYDSFEALRDRLGQVNPVFNRQGTPRFGITELAGPAGDASAMGSAAFVSTLGDYYQTNVISRASPTMAECSRVYYPRPVAQAAE